MYKISTQRGLSLFWRYASQHPDVLISLLNVRMEHGTLGRGTVVEVVPKPDEEDGPKAYLRVLFDEARTHKKKAATNPKLLLLPFVLEKELLNWLAVPRAEGDAFRSFAMRATLSAQTGSQGSYLPSLPRLKKDWRAFQDLVKRHGVKSLYHFTDSRNLESIRRHGGLCSWHECGRMGIRISHPGGNEVSRQMDQKHGLQDYVRLGFNPCLPMMFRAREEGRISEPAILRIDPAVCYLESTLFSHVNANDAGASAGGDIESFERIDFGLATGRRWEGQTQKKLFQAEVLVKRRVPLNLIENL